ncbi:MAG: twin-arginine translocase TatA/TatE family subunit [Anaerolineaceae bacterium]|nr:twin-arginine translocase TatA/TatE family subunit [Anaerolineaceae bacterium]
MGIGWPEAILILVIVLLVFGVDRISKVAGEMGKGVRAFKDGLGNTEKTDPNEENGQSKEKSER